MSALRLCRGMSAPDGFRATEPGPKSRRLPLCWTRRAHGNIERRFQVERNRAVEGKALEDYVRNVADTEPAEIPQFCDAAFGRRAPGKTKPILLEVRRGTQQDSRNEVTPICQLQCPNLEGQG